MSDFRVSFPKPCGEKWEDMAPRECGRLCDSCDKIVHDLAQLTGDDVDALVQSGSEICVRAQVGPDGIVKLKPGGKHGGRRMVTAISASVGLLAMSGQALAADSKPRGAITGGVNGSCGGDATVTATDAEGRIYTAKVGTNGRYKVKRLPAGSYEVQVRSGDETWNGGKVVVRDRQTTMFDATSPNQCIIIGMLKVENADG